MHRPRFYRNPRPNFNCAPNFQPRGRGRFPGPHTPNLRFDQHWQTQTSNDEHWCETCDKAFPTVAKLEEHKQQHQKCNIDGCQFTAHPNMVTKHIQMQHSTGLYKKIGNLNNPEAINKWREERKKRYPSKLNVDKKAAEIKEKIERGEKIGLTQERFPNKQLNNQAVNVTGAKDQQRNYPFGRKHQDSLKRSHQTNTENYQAKKTRRKFPIKKPDLDISQPGSNGKLKPFAGIQQLVYLNDDIDENEKFNDLIEYDIDSDSPVKTTEELNNVQNICSALSTLICNYGSSDEDTLEKENKIDNNADLPKENKIDNNTDLPKNNSSQIANNIDILTVEPQESETNTEVINKTEAIDDEDSGPEEVKVSKTINTDDSTEPKTSLKCDEKQINFDPNKNARHKPDQQKRKQFYNLQRKPKVPSTLIYKLLHKEIRQERNIVLQCIRHIVKNKFFDQQK